MRRLTVNLPDELYRALVQHRDSGGYSSHSVAAAALLSQALGVDTTLPAWGGARPPQEKPRKSE